MLVGDLSEDTNNPETRSNYSAPVSTGALSSFLRNVRSRGVIAWLEKH